MPSECAGNETFSGVRAFILGQLVEEVVPSLAVAVGREGEILWEEGFGWADREQRMPATEHTMYSLASISKPITATGLMVLQQRGQLDLDRPVNDYLGEAKLRAWVGEATGATVRRVANHTSGLPLHWNFFGEDEPERRPPMVETIRRYGNLVTAPGEKYQYSNLGYGVLDHVIARLSGKSYLDFMRQEVFLPLGMTRASVDIGPGLEACAAARYSGEGARLPFYDFDHPGGSAIFCSVHDLIRFGMFHLKAHLPDQKAILSDETLDAMQALTACSGGAAGYGIGWAINEDRMGYRRVSHDGGMDGVSTTLQLYPAERLAVAVLANSRTDLPQRVADEILSALLPEFAERRAQKQEQDEPEAKPPFQPPPELIGEWRGSVRTYRSELPLTFWFKKSGDIHAQLGTQLKTLLNDARLEEDRLTGKMLGDIGTDDANRRPYHLHVDVKRRGEVLNGVLTAISLPGRPLGSALGHWMELQKS